MPQGSDKTVSFKLDRESEEKVSAILQEVYQALAEKGYNPVGMLKRLLPICHKLFDPRISEGVLHHLFQNTIRNSSYM
jgi:hypothetical protein